MSYFGTDGKPCLNKDGYAGWTAHLRRAGKQDEHVLLRHRRQALPEQGRICRMEGHLRRAGKQDGHVLLWHRRQALPDKDGYAGWKAQFDERGNQTSVSYFGSRRQALLEQGRLCRMEVHLSTSGETRPASRYFGIDGKPCLLKDGNAGRKVTYDERGNRTSVSYFGIDGKPCMSKDGYAGWKATFDGRERNRGSIALS